MAWLLVPLSAVLRNLGGEFRNTGSVQFAGPGQVQQFTLGHNTVGKAVFEGAVGPSEGADDIDAILASFGQHHECL